MDRKGPVLVLDCVASRRVGLVWDQPFRVESIAIPKSEEDPRGLDVMPALARLLQANDVRTDALSRCAVHVGPGPMTGIRVGMATMKAICDVYKLPIVPLVGWFGHLDLANRSVQEISFPLSQKQWAVGTIAYEGNQWLLQAYSLVSEAPKTEAGGFDFDTFARVAIENQAVESSALQPLYLREPDVRPQVDGLGRPLGL